MKRFLTVTDGLAKPNYFLSIPITDPSLISRYIAFRERLLSSYPSLLSASSPHILTCDAAHLHLILLTLRLGSPVQLEQCIQALKRTQEEIHYHCSYPERIWLDFNGLETFFGKTLYIKCQGNTRLDNLRTLIIERLCEQQQKQKVNELFFAGNYQEFIPHIILFKSKRKLSILPHDQTQEVYFGKQTINALHLTSFGTNENDQQSNHCVFKLDLSWLQKQNKREYFVSRSDLLSLLFSSCCTVWTSTSPFLSRLANTFFMSFRYFYMIGVCEAR